MSIIFKHGAKYDHSKTYNNQPCKWITEMKTSGLSLAEAHATGRKYRRANNPSWGDFDRYWHTTQLPLQDAIATDYELEIEPKSFTKDEMQQWFALVRSEVVCGYDWEWRSFEEDKILDKMFNTEAEA